MEASPRVSGFRGGVRQAAEVSPSGEKRYLSERSNVVIPEGVFPAPFPGEAIGREKPLTAAYLDDLEASLVVSTSRAFNSVQRAESLVAQLKVSHYYSRCLLPAL